MNTSLKIFWNNNPIPLEEKISKSDIVVEIPFGVMITSPSGSSPVTSVNGKIGNVVLNADDVGATTQLYVDQQDQVLQNDIDTKANASSVNQALSLKADLIGGTVPASQLPSFVDDVLEFQDLSSFPAIGEDSKIYIAIDSNKTYRWSGSNYVEIGGGGVALGETSSTAYRGDRGKIAYDHALSQGNPHNTSASEILLDVLSLLDSSSVAIGDTLAVIAGKLQAQINAIGGGAVEWVSASTIGTAHVNADVSLLEFAKINGMLFCRGFFKVNGRILTEDPLFTITNDSYKVIRPALTTLKNYSGSLSVFTSSTTAYGLRFMVTGNCIDAESASLSTQALEPSAVMASNSEYFSVAQNFCFGQLVTP